MLEDAPGSPDGVTVMQYSEGETYDVPQDLADTMIRHELAEPLTVIVEPKPDDEPKPARRGRKATAPPENK